MLDQLVTRANELLLKNKNELGVQYTVPYEHAVSYVENKFERHACAGALAKELQKRFSEEASPFLFERSTCRPYEHMIRSKMELYVLTRSEREELLRIIRDLARLASITGLDAR